MRSDQAFSIGLTIGAAVAQQMAITQFSEYRSRYIDADGLARDNQKQEWAWCKPIPTIC